MIPAIGIIIKLELELTNLQLGALGSLVYAGGVVGSLVAIPCFEHFKTRNVVIVSLLFQIATLVAFFTGNSYEQLALARFFSGVF